MCIREKHKRQQTQQTQHNTTQLNTTCSNATPKTNFFPQNKQKVAGETERPIKINPSVMSLLKMLTYMTYIAHILGCMWHWLVTFEEEGISWASKFGIEEASSIFAICCCCCWNCFLCGSQRAGSSFFRVCVWGGGGVWLVPLAVTTTVIYRMGTAATKT